MGLRYGSEERAFVRPRDEELRDPSTYPGDYTSDAIALSQVGQNRLAQQGQRMAEEQALAVKAGGQAIGEALPQAAKGYQQGAEYATRQGQEELKTQQMQREAARDQSLGDRAALARVNSEEAGVESTKAGIEATKANTARTQALTPIEVQRQQQELSINPLIKKEHQLAIARTETDLKNDMDNRDASIVAVLINEAKRGAKTPEAAMKAEASEMERLKTSYKPAILAAGQKRARDSAMQEGLLDNSIKNSDPKFQEAQGIRQKAIVAANTMSELKAEYAKYVQGAGYVWDSSEARQARDNIQAKLRELDQQQLLSSTQKNQFQAAFTPGEDTLTKDRLGRAITSLSNTLKPFIVRATDEAASKKNPHLNRDEMQNYLNAVSFDPNAPGAEGNVLQNVKSDEPEATPGGTVTTGGISPSPAPKAPPDFRGGKGARPLAQPPIQGR